MAYQFTDNRQINDLLNQVVEDLRQFTESQHQHIEKLTQVGIALSSEHRLDYLLEIIVDQARHLTHADGGTLYLLTEDGRALHFTVAQNDSLGIRMGGTADPISWPDLPLYRDDGSANKDMVAAVSALTEQTIRIDNVYQAQGFDFEGTRKFDANTGYRSQSMLVVPMKNHEDEIIGVCQLINRIDPATSRVTSFSEDDALTAQALASQAAVAITTARLINDLQNLLEAIIHTVATAIDAKSPYTGGHVRKVAVVGSMIAEAVSACQEGRYKDVHYSADELDQIRIAGLLHDIGKITTPEYVMDKATKLETIHDRIESIVPRFDAIKARVELGYAQRELEALRAGQAYDRTAQQQALQQELEALDDDRAFLEQANIGGEFMSDAAVARVRQIGARMWQHDGYREPLLTDDEIMNLTVRKGTLTDAERQVINDHVRLSIEMLEGLPFPKKLARVPEIGGNHHEKLNGQGYPRGLNAEQLSLEARILALADIFEALTSSDRPYKKAKPLSEVRRILGFMAKDYELDPDLLDFFYQQGLDVRFARQELTPEQLDIEEP